MEAIRDVANFLCFETMHKFVSANIVNTKVEELEKKIATLERDIARADQVHKKEIEERKKTSNDEITKVKKAHERELTPLKELTDSLDRMDGVKFGNPCHAVVLWNADRNADCSAVKCLQCGIVCKDHRINTAVRLTGRRSSVNTSSSLIRW